MLKIGMKPRLVKRRWPAFINFKRNFSFILFSDQFGFIKQNSIIGESLWQHLLWRTDDQENFVK
jgi:hypothetical protein